MLLEKNNPTFFYGDENGNENNADTPDEDNEGTVEENVSPGIPPTG
jgi:hypothetical protein